MIHNTPSSNAREALASARSAHYALRDAYADPAHPPPAGTAAELHTAVKYGLKVAEVEAALAIADEVAQLRAALTAGTSRATFTERVAAVASRAVPSAERVMCEDVAPSAIHHPSCPARGQAGGDCLGCPRVVTPSVVEVTSRIAAARR